MNTATATACAHRSLTDYQPWPELPDGEWLATCEACHTSVTVSVHDVPEWYRMREDLAARLYEHRYPGRRFPVHAGSRGEVKKYRERAATWLGSWGIRS